MAQQQKEAPQQKEVQQQKEAQPREAHPLGKNRQPRKLYHAKLPAVKQPNVVLKNNPLSAAEKSIFRGTISYPFRELHP